jgi:hypothetical protein
VTSAYVRYDYAWKTPGWSVQNPSLPTTDADGYVDPGLPADISLVRVYYSALEFASGRNLSGVLRLRVDKILTHVPTQTQLFAGGIPVTRFRKDGFSIYLPATDDPQLTPSFLYEARLTVHGKTQEFTFALPAATPEVNLTTLIPT